MANESDSLKEQYDALKNQHNQLQGQHNQLNTQYNQLIADFDKLRARVEFVDREVTIWTRSAKYVGGALLILLAILVGLTKDNIAQAVQDEIKKMATEETGKKVQEAYAKSLDEVEHLRDDASRDIKDSLKTTIQNISAAEAESLRSISDVNQQIVELSGKLASNFEQVQAKFAEKLSQSDSLLLEVKSKRVEIEKLVPQLDQLSLAGRASNNEIIGVPPGSTIDDWNVIVSPRYITRPNEKAYGSDTSVISGVWRVAPESNKKGWKIIASTTHKFGKASMDGNGEVNFLLVRRGSQ